MKEVSRRVALGVLLGLGLGLQALAAEPPPPAPDWQLPRLDGGEVGLGEFRGQVVLLDFWASWCVPCRASLPALSALREDFVGQPVAIVALSVDQDPAAARRFRDRYAPQLPSAIDADGTVAAAYDLLGMPTSFIIDAEGQLVHRHEGFRKGDEDAWRREIRALLPAGR